MPTGFRGPLVSRQFAGELPARFAGRLGETALPVVRRRFVQWARQAARLLGPASGLLAIREVGAGPLARLLGYELRDAASQSDAASFHESTLHTRTSRAAALVLTPWSDRLDGRARTAVNAAVLSGVRWALLFNGHGLRLIDADRPYARPFIEFDLSAAARDDQTIALLWGMLRPDALCPRRGGDRPVLPDILDASAAHARGVAHALQGGVQEALAHLARALHHAAPGARTSPEGTVAQAVTIVFRLLFLLFAEARALVPMWHPVYRDSYAIHGLRALVERRAPDGLWDALQAISRLAHQGCAVADLRVTAFNGRLFAPEHTPLESRAQVSNRAMADVLRALTDVGSGPDGPARPVAYGDLGVEQLGSIYERLLDVTPVLEETLAAAERPQRARVDPVDPGRARAAVPEVAAAGPRRRSPHRRVSGRRKESGTFYTPRTMADDLVRETLAPLVRDREADDILGLRVLDPAMGSGAFLVSAGRFLAEAYLHALERAGHLPGDEAVDVQRASALRRVVQRCLYGVDVNPVATGLARLSLWLASLAADRPLTFLDHHLRTGDSLVGASIDDLARGWRTPARTRRGTATLPLFDGDDVGVLIRGLMPIRDRLAAPDEEVETVRRKEQLLADSLRSGLLARWLQLADLWCARWCWPAASTPPPQAAWADLADAVLRDRSSLPQAVIARWLAEARRTAAERRFLHWSLHFPEVFFDAVGQPRPDAGFDAIVGNPPWDMVRDDVREGALRDETAAERSLLSAFARDAGIYDRSGGGHLNRYHLFVDRSLALLRPGGRLGLVLPWGVAVDRAAATLRRRLFERCDTDRLVAFENGEGIFPIHRGVRFVLWTATTGRPTRATQCRIGERSLDALDRGPQSARDVWSVSPAFLRRVSGEGLEVPWLRSAADVALVARLHQRWPALASPDGWHVSFGRELNATDDRDWFTETGTGPLVVDGRHVRPFRLTPDDRPRRVREDVVGALRARVPGISRARLAYRDVASSTNRLTLIAALLPAGVVSTHTLFCLRTPLDLERQRALCALLNSFVANYLVRLRVTTHVSTYLVEALPMPVPSADTCGRLARAAQGLERDDDRDGAMAARLQALCAREFGLEAHELAHVLETFPLIGRPERQAVVEAFRGWGVGVGSSE